MYFITALTFQKDCVHYFRIIGVGSPPLDEILKGFVF